MNDLSRNSVDPKDDREELASAPTSSRSSIPIDQTNSVPQGQSIRAVLYYREEDRRRLQELKRQCAVRNFIFLTETTVWDDAIDLAKKRLVDVVVVPSFSSFPVIEGQFPPLDLYLTEKELRDRGASFFVISEGVGTATATGRFMFTSMAALHGYRRLGGSSD